MKEEPKSQKHAMRTSCECIQRALDTLSYHHNGSEIFRGIADWYADNERNAGPNLTRILLAMDVMLAVAFDGYDQPYSRNEYLAAVANFKEDTESALKEAKGIIEAN